MKGTDIHVEGFCNRISTGGYKAKYLVKNSSFFHKSCYADYRNILKWDSENERLEKKSKMGDSHLCNDEHPGQKML